MAFIKVWIHFVWTTKRREPSLKNSIRYKVLEHIKENAKNKNIYIDSINGYLEHIHCLVSLKSTETIEEIARLLKGESSHWINQQHLTPGKFDWQNKYFAVSVSESLINKVRNYIKNQEEHHSKKNFTHEYEEFIKKYGFDELND